MLAGDKPLERSGKKQRERVPPQATICVDLPRKNTHRISQRDSIATSKKAFCCWCVMQQDAQRNVQPSRALPAWNKCCAARSCAMTNPPCSSVVSDAVLKKNLSRSRLTFTTMTVVLDGAAMYFQMLAVILHYFSYRCHAIFMAVYGLPKGHIKNAPL